MVVENKNNEREIRRFLIGGMSEDERSAFERSFVADEDLFIQISVIEDELIESYILETLSPDERRAFEREFLSIDSRRRSLSSQAHHSQPGCQAVAAEAFSSR